MKVKVYFLVLDSLLTHFESRFSDNSLTLVKQVFSHEGVVKTADEMKTGKGKSLVKK